MWFNVATVIWCHYKCTQLPLYQLYIYDLTSRKYACEPCCEVPDDVKNDYQSLSYGSAVTSSVGVNTCTEVITRDDKINTVSAEKVEKGMNTVNSVMKEASTSVDFAREGKIYDGVCQCEKMEGDYVKLIGRMTETFDQLKEKKKLIVILIQPSHCMRITVLMQKSRSKKLKWWKGN